MGAGEQVLEEQQWIHPSSSRGWGACEDGAWVRVEPLTPPNDTGLPFLGPTGPSASCWTSSPHLSRMFALDEAHTGWGRQELRVSRLDHTQ